MLRKRKNSTEESGQKTPVRDSNAQNFSPGEKVHHKVVRLSNVIWLLLGLLIGSISGGPWLKELEDVIYGYRWNYLDRCILETPESGYGVDFCRTPVNCDTCRHVRRIDEVHVSEISWEEFYSGYADIGRPLIIRNATLHWPIMTQLTFEWLKKAYLSDPEILDYDDKECWFNNYKSKQLGSLRSVFRMAGPRERDWYVGWAVCQPQIAEKLLELYERPTFLHPDSTPPKKPWIFIGTPGPGAHVHIDNVDLSSWQAQVSGTKSWLLRPPPECWLQCHGDMEARVSPGDIIVVNTNLWYHSTRIEGEDISLVITNEFDYIS